MYHLDREIRMFKNSLAKLGLVNCKTHLEDSINIKNKLSFTKLFLDKPTKLILNDLMQM